MFVKKLTEVQKEEVKGAVKTARQVLISADEGPNFAMRKFTIEPGGEMPMHTNTVEHEQLVLNGRAKVTIAEESLEVRKDDVVFIPSGIPHCYKTIGDEPFSFLCVVPNKTDVMEILK